MKSTFKRLTIFSVIAVFLLASPAVFSQPMCEGDGPEGMRGPHKGKMFDRLSEKLDLTEEQQKQMEELRKSNMEEMKQLHEEIRDKKGALQEELQKPVTDEGKIDSIVKELKDLQGKQIENRVDHFISMKEILTPEQFQKFIDLKEEGKERWQEKRGRGWEQPRRKFGPRF